MSEEAGKRWLSGCTVLFARRCVHDHGSIIGQRSLVLIVETKSMKWQKPTYQHVSLLQSKTRFQFILNPRLHVDIAFVWILLHSL